MSSDHSQQIIFGNAQTDGNSRHGWFIGHFVNDNLARCSAEVEVKWGIHAAGEHRSQWSSNHTATTVSILIQGRFRIYFPEREFLLTQKGDYALWFPKVPHYWLVETDSTLITVRFPSTPGDTIEELKEELKK